MLKFLTAIPVARESMLLSLERLHTEFSNKQISDYVKTPSIPEEEPHFSMGCGPAWQAAKKSLLEIFPTMEAYVTPLDSNRLRTALEKTKKKFPANYLRTSECGLARLSLEIGNLVAADFQVDELLGAEVISSPIMTVALDYPWEEISESDWPIFAFLAQLQLASIGNISPEDFGNDLSGEFFAALLDGLNREDLEIVYNASYAYLNLSQEHFPVATLCALAGLATLDKGALPGVQNFLRRIATSVDDLIFSLKSPWPLWPLVAISSR